MRHLFVGTALALSLTAVCALEVVQPNSNLLADGIPAIPKAIADKVALYTEFRGFGFVDMATSEDAAKCIEMLNDTTHMNRQLAVREKEDRPKKSFGGGGGNGGNRSSRSW